MQTLMKSDLNRLVMELNKFNIKSIWHLGETTSAITRLPQNKRGNLVPKLSVLYYLPAGNENSRMVCSAPVALPETWNLKEIQQDLFGKVIEVPASYIK